MDTARVLAADAVQKVGNGHPGTAMSLAPVAYLLFQKIMRHDPSDDRWTGRDRFILSPGHTSLTLYSQLFFSGYGLEMSDLESLRTWGSKVPGHPEYRHTTGVEITTGPLGQGLASSVGFAYAQRYTRGLFDADAAQGTSPFDHHVFVIASDGDLQEGITSEASSLAGTQELGNLVVIYDDNKISIEDDTNVAFNEDVLARYEAYGWDTTRVDWRNGGQYQEDVQGLYDAIVAATKVTDKPSLIALSTIIGWPSPTKQNTGGIHGSKLGTDEVAGLKESLGLDPTKTFDVDPELLARARSIAERSAEYRRGWEVAFQAWREANPENARLYDRLAGRELPAGFADAFPSWDADEKGLATRAASGEVLTALAPVMPELWGGSADLAGSNNTTMKGEPSFIPARRSTATWQGHEYGRTLHFGVREFAAGAIVNGITIGGLTRAYVGTFLTFSDYMRPAVRLAALMGTPSTYVWTHDSIGLGEDGPTHQPVEHLAALRAIPGLDVVRPADANETAWAWRTVLEHRDRPAGLVLSRQSLPVLPRDTDGFAPASGVARGAYVLIDATDADGAPTPARALLIATGSEVSVAVRARALLQADGVPTRVVSAPCLEWFAEQDEAYRAEVLPDGPDAPVRVSVEAGIAMPWFEHTVTASSPGARVSLEHYGESADGARLMEKYGFTGEHVAEVTRGLL